MAQVQLGMPVVFRPGTAHEERWGPGQFLSAMITSISGSDASLLVFPDLEQPYYEIRVKRDDALATARTWTPSVGEAQGLPDAPADGRIYGRLNQSWEPFVGTAAGYIESVFASDVPPPNALQGMMWLDTTINNLYIYLVQGSNPGIWVEPAHINPPV